MCVNKVEHNFGTTTNLFWLWANRLGFVPKSNFQEKVVVFTFQKRTNSSSRDIDWLSWPVLRETMVSRNHGFVVSMGFGETNRTKPFCKIIETETNRTKPFLKIPKPKPAERNHFRKNRNRNQSNETTQKLWSAETETVFRLWFRFFRCILKTFYHTLFNNPLKNFPLRSLNPKVVTRPFSVFFFAKKKSLHQGYSRREGD